MKVNILSKSISNGLVSYPADISGISPGTIPLAQQKDKLCNFIEKLGEGVAIIDLTYDFLLCNKALEEIFETNDLINRNLSEFMASNIEMEKLMDLAGKLDEGDRSSMEISIKTAGNHHKHLSITLTPQMNTKGNMQDGLFCIFKDISHTNDLIEELQAARDDAQKAYETIEEKNRELREINERLHVSETRLSELNAILLEYIKATHK
jgi:transcriptional regulator of aromatic amino acid metabolism